MRTIGVVTVGRSDYGIYLPILRKLKEDADLRLHLFVSGMHLSPEFGSTVHAIEADGFKVSERVEMLLSSDTPEGIAKSIGLGVIGFAQTFARCRPDVLLVLGDRFEMYSACLAALPFKIPVAHVHGGEVTQGAIDDALRHSLTKLSHLHFVSTPESARRVAQLGEESWRIIVSGAPSLDNLRSVALLDRRQLEARFRLRWDKDPLLVTFHPVSLEYEQTEYQVAELLNALGAFDLPVVFTMPNADTSSRLVTRMLNDFAKDRPRAMFIGNLGTQAYFSVMAAAAAMVGNSSSGIIEAPSFALPVVNIGTRQEGRLRAENVIDVGYTSDEIREGIRKALDPDFRAALQGTPNPYGGGHAAEIIVKQIKEIAIDDRLISKRFVDWAIPISEKDTPRVA